MRSERLRGPAALMAQAVSLLAPPRCLACRATCAVGRVVCGDCAHELSEFPPGLPAARRGPALAGHFAAYPMAGAARALVHALKFGGGVAAAREMARLIAVRSPPWLFDTDWLVPAPAHPLRRRERGYNQSELLSREIAALTGLPVIDCLARIGSAPAQTGQPRERRLRLDPSTVVIRSGCRFAAEPLARRKTKVVLVDDVSTTGVTLEICASVICKRTESQVRAVTFAGTGAGPGSVPSHPMGDWPTPG